VRGYESPGGQLPGLLLKLVPTSLFDLHPFTVFPKAGGGNLS
jgi:hypothetical protein